MQLLHFKEEWMLIRIDAIDRLIHEQHPEVQWGDAPKGV